MSGTVSWEINVPFQQKIGYIRDEVLGGDNVRNNVHWLEFNSTFNTI